MPDEIEEGLWGMEGEHLPAYIKRVYRDLVQGGKPTGSPTYRLAVGIVQNWAKGTDGKGGKVTAKTQAKAVKAIAEWNKLRAKAKMSENGNLVGRIAEEWVEEGGKPDFLKKKDDGPDKGEKGATKTCPGCKKDNAADANKCARCKKPLIGTKATGEKKEKVKESVETGSLAEGLGDVKGHVRKVGGKTVMVKGYKVKRAFKHHNFDIGVKADGSAITIGPEGKREHPSEAAAKAHAEKTTSPTGTPPKASPQKGDSVEFDVGKRTVVGKVKGPAAGGTKVVVDTPDGEYTMMVSDVRAPKKSTGAPKTPLLSDDEAAKKVRDAAAGFPIAKGLKPGHAAPSGQWTQHSSGDMEIEMPKNGPTAKITQDENGGPNKWSAYVFPNHTSNENENRQDFDSDKDAKQWADSLIRRKQAAGSGKNANAASVAQEGYDKGKRGSELHAYVMNRLGLSFEEADRATAKIRRG